MRTVVKTAVASLGIVTSIVVILLLFHVIEFRYAVTLEIVIAFVHLLAGVTDILLDRLAPEPHPSQTSHDGRHSIASRARTRVRPIKRFAIFLFAIGFLALAVTLFALPFLPSPWAQWAMQTLGIRSPIHAHVWALAMFLFVLILAVIFFVKNNAKHRKLLRVERATQSLAGLSNPVAPSNPFAHGEADKYRRAIEGVLHDLLVSTDKIIAPLRPLSTRSIRTAWILVPDSGSGEFRTVHFVSSSPGDDGSDYSSVVSSHRPKLWDRKAFEEISREWEAKKHELKDLKFFARRRRKKAMRNRLQACGSLTGFIFEQDRPRAYKDVTHCEVFDASYIDLLPDERRQELMFRSAAGISLRVNSKPVAVLLLYGTIERAFGEPDSTTLRTWSNLLSPYVAANVERGLYN